MKRNRKFFNFLLVLFALAGLGFLTSCSDDLMDDVKPTEINKTADLSEQNVQGRLKTGSNGSIMMQAFYWDVPAGGTWWNTVNGKIDDWADNYVNAIWLPPVSKAQNGAFSMGYDPFDYYDFGEYDQMGSVETRFGSKTELQSLISSAHGRNINVIADIVMNHNSGGDSEYNPYTGTNTWTDYNPASGMFYRTYNDFHPNDIQSNDEGAFGGFPDLCHRKEYVSGWLWSNSNSVAKYYVNTMGFDGYRLDYVKGFAPWVAKEFKNSTGVFSVGEYWDSNVSTLDWWSTEADQSVFDFALYYAMDDAFDNGNMYALDGAGYAAVNPTRAVTFVTNHDTDEIWNKMMAYAFILTMEGYPCVFYRDYEEWLSKEDMQNLMWIHHNLADGTTTKKYLDNDEFILQRNGNPGLLLYLNNSSGTKSQWVQTKWNNTSLKDYTGKASGTVTTNSSGWVQISAPGNSYSVWSPTDGGGNDPWYFSGAPNNWGATEMTDAGNNNWEITRYMNQGDGFKIRRSATDWNEAYPDQNWVIWEGSGTYTITFNASSHYISVVKQ